MESMTANDPPIPRQIRRDFRPLFVLTAYPDAFKQMEIYAVGRRIPSRSPDNGEHSWKNHAWTIRSLTPFAFC